MKQRYKFLSVLIGTALIWGGTSELNLEEKLGEVDEVNINIDFGMGEFDISAGERNTAVSGQVTYDADNVDIQYSYKEYRNEGEFHLDTDWHDDDNHHDEDDIGMELFFTPKVPLNFNIDLGLGEGNMDLEKLKMGNLDLECGLGEADIDFGKHGNQTMCRTVDIESGLGSIDITNLANSNAREMNFECGLGDIDLDFSGDLKHDVKIEISVGLGSMDISIPEGTNAIVHYEGSFFADLDLSGFDKIDDDEYISSKFRKGKPTLFFTASVGMGSIDVHWID